LVTKLATPTSRITTPKSGSIPAAVRANISLQLTLGKVLETFRGAAWFDSPRQRPRLWRGHEVAAPKAAELNRYPALKP